MSIRKNVFVAIALAVGMSSAFAISKTRTFNHQPIYTAHGTFIGCYYDGSVNCGSRVPTSDYYYLSNGTINPVPINYQPLRIP